MRYNQPMAASLSDRPSQPVRARESPITRASVEERIWSKCSFDKRARARVCVCVCVCVCVEVSKYALVSKYSTTDCKQHGQNTLGASVSRIYGIPSDRLVNEG